MDTATKVQFVTAYRKFKRVPFDLISAYATVKLMENAYTYSRATTLSYKFVTHYNAWLTHCDLDWMFEALDTAISDFITSEEAYYYDDF